MANYAALSLETNLFFARIMKEHALFLEAGFPCKNEDWIKKADWFKREFEEILCQAVTLGEGRVGSPVLQSGELTTCFTLAAEQKTEELSGICINTEITAAQEKMCAGCREEDREFNRRVYRMNDRAICLTKELIGFKESILREVHAGKLFNWNYPLLLKHIIREARMYCETLVELQRNGCISRKKGSETEDFWNRIMMEHALFIRGLLDPSEDELICTADEFAEKFHRLLREGKCQEPRKAAGLTEKSKEETVQLRDFKAAGTKEILEQEIASLILPLLADHVLREANHYIRVLCQEV